MRKQRARLEPHGAVMLQQRRSGLEKTWILNNQWMTEVIYPFLYSSFGQSIAISKIVDFNVFDVVTILLVDLAGDSLVGVDGRRLDDWRSGRLQVVSARVGSNATVRRTERMGGTSTCWMPFFAWICALILAAAAAAAAAALFFMPALDGLSVASRATGLRSRCDSDSFRDGDL